MTCSNRGLSLGHDAPKPPLRGRSGRAEPRSRLSARAGSPLRTRRRSAQRNAGKPVGAGVQQARVVIDLFQSPVDGRHALGDEATRRVKQGLCLETIASGQDRALHERLEPSIRSRPARKAPTVPELRSHTVDAESYASRHDRRRPRQRGTSDGARCTRRCGSTCRALDSAVPELREGYVAAAARWLRCGVRQRNWRKNSRTSPTRRSGASSAAKWPPRLNSVQWTTL